MRAKDQEAKRNQKKKQVKKRKGMRKTIAPRLRASSRTALLTESADATLRRSNVMRNSHQRIAVAVTKTCTFKPYPDCTVLCTVLQYYGTCTVPLLHCCWLLLDSYLRKANRRPPNTKQVAVAITLPFTSASRQMCGFLSF